MVDVDKLYGEVKQMNEKFDQSEKSLINKVWKWSFLFLSIGAFVMALITAFSGAAGAALVMALLFTANWFIYMLAVLMLGVYRTHVNAEVEKTKSWHDALSQKKLSSLTKS